VLLAALAVILLAAIGFAIVALVAKRAARWLGIGPMTVLVFFGIADTLP